MIDYPPLIAFRILIEIKGKHCRKPLCRNGVVDHIVSTRYLNSCYQHQFDIGTFFLPRIAICVILLLKLDVRLSSKGNYI